MARALRVQFPGAFYHITCRGVERRFIYGNDMDRDRFLELLTRSLVTYQVVLHAYIMMTNHFHLLIQTRKANCAEFMRHFNISYTGWFNWHHKRCGNLYQGRYKAFLIDADNYLLEVSRYLHLNHARKINMAAMSYQEHWRDAQAYPWSSLLGYLRADRVMPYINYDLILSMAGGRQRYRDFMRDGLQRNCENPFCDLKSRLILGDEDFVARVKRCLKYGSLRDQPDYRDLVVTRLEPEQVMDILTRYFGINLDLLRQRRGNGMLRGIAAELMYKYCKITQAKVGFLLGGIDYGAVHLLRRRMKEQITKDDIIRKQYAEVEAKVQDACRM